LKNIYDYQRYKNDIASISIYSRCTSTLCVKKHPDIFDRNLKTNYQILIIFG